MGGLLDHVTSLLLSRVWSRVNLSLFLSQQIQGQSVILRDCFTFVSAEYDWDSEWSAKAWESL